MCGLGPADVLMVEDDPGDALMVRGRANTGWSWPMTATSL